MKSIRMSFPLEPSDPFTHQQAGRNTRNGVNMILSPIKGMKEDALCFQDRMFQKMVESALDCFRNDRITLFSIPGDVKIDLAVNVFWHEVSPRN